MGHSVSKTLKIDDAKLKRARAYLGLDTDTEVIDLLLDRLLDDSDFERELAALLKEAPATFRDFRSPFVARRPRR